MPKPYHTLYTSCFFILLSMPYVSLATQSTENNIDQAVFVIMDVQNIELYSHNNRKKIRTTLKKHYLSSYVKTPGRYAFKMPLKSMKNNTPSLFSIIKEHLKKGFSLTKQHFCISSFRKGHYSINFLRELKKHGMYSFYNCFTSRNMPNSSLVINNFYILRPRDHSDDCSIFGLRFDSIKPESLNSTDNNRLDTLHTNRHFTIIYLEDMFPISLPNTTPPTFVATKVTPKKISRAKKQPKSYAKLSFYPFHQATQQFMEKYSSNKNGTFTFKKYPQDVRFLDLRKKFANNLSVNQKFLKDGIHPSFIYLYNDKKEKINLSKTNRANYNPTIKELWKEQALDKQLKSVSSALTLSLFYKITYYPQLVHKS